jgi:hypothetical protein
VSVLIWWTEGALSDEWTEQNVIVPKLLNEFSKMNGRKYFAGSVTNLTFMET